MKVVSRAGKKNGSFEDLDTGHVRSYTLREVSIKSGSNVSDMETYVAMVPRYLHNDKRCQVAKQKELEKFNKFAINKKVKDENQPRMGTNWIITEKVINEEIKVKARLTI